jgi:outer membrane usher protein
VGNAYVATGKSSTLALSYAHGITTDGTSSLTADLTYGRPLWGGRLNVDILHTGPSPATTLVTATYSLQLGARGWGTLSAARGGDGASGQLVSYTQALPNSPTGFAYGLQAQRSVAAGATYAANASEQLTNATISQQFFRGQDTTLVTADVAGSVDFVDHSVIMARSIGQGFGLVELPGYPGIPVYVSGQEVGRTDAHGLLVLPQLQPYQTNDIMLAAQDLPIGVDLATSALQIAPYGLSPGIARFIVKSAGGVSITLVDSRGAAWPTGTKILSADGKQTWLVALDGVAYLSGVQSGRQRFTASAGAASCSFEINVPGDTARLPDLGRTACR